MNVAFRVDSSRSIGAGHLMRCLTLADELVRGGAAVHFICRALPGNFGAWIGNRGHAMHWLAAPEPGCPSQTGGNAYAGWLGVTPSRDGTETMAILDDLGCDMDWLIVDHYAIDARWERMLHPAVGGIMAIDDLANRTHDVDLVLDQTLGRKPEHYVAHVSGSCGLLLGPTYALLRPSFANLRVESLARRTRVDRVRRILVSMGGVDAAGLCVAALDAVALSGLSLEVDVVLGGNDRALAAVRKRADDANFSVRIHADTERMAELMQDADLAIGAGGMTSWERCCLGLPTLVIVTAENQGRIVTELARAGAVISLGHASSVHAGTIAAALVALAGDAGRLRDMSASAASLCDGAGVSRVLEALNS